MSTHHHTCEVWELKKENGILITQWLNTKYDEGFRLSYEEVSGGHLILMMQKQRATKQIKREPNIYQMKWQEGDKTVVAELKELI